MNDYLYEIVAKQLATDAICKAEHEVQTEYKHIVTANQESGNILADNALRAAFSELDDEENTAMKHVHNAIRDAFNEIEEEKPQTAVKHIAAQATKENVDFENIKAMDLAYDRAANKLAIDAINQTNDDLQNEIAERMGHIAGFDWSSVDKHIQETLDTRIAGMRRAMARLERETRGTQMVGEEVCLPNSVSDSVMDTRPWRRYVTIDMGEVVVRANSDVVNFFISPRDTPSPMELYLESPREYDVTKLTPEVSFDNVNIANQATDLHTKKELDTAVDISADVSSVIMPGKGSRKKGHSKKGFTSRCRKLLRFLFPCCKAQNKE